MSSALTFSGTTVRFGTGRSAMTAVDHVDLVVPAGTVLGLVGESGSGKSTLARAATGLAHVAEGKILLDDLDITNARGALARERLRVQMVFQDPYSSLDPRMSVGQSIAEAMGAARKRSTSRSRSRADTRAETARLLGLVHLDAGLASALPSRLSGGQRQRIALARVLAAEPDVVIADEITSALDVSVQGSVLNLLREVQAQLGLTILFVSHNLAVVRYVSDTVAVMRSGTIVEQGPVEQVLSAPEHPYTRELLSAIPTMGEPLTME